MIINTQQGQVEVTPVEIVGAEEGTCVYRLADGEVLRVRFIVTQVFRVQPAGADVPPSYYIDHRAIPTVVPQEQQRQQPVSATEN